MQSQPSIRIQLKRRRRNVIPPRPLRPKKTSTEITFSLTPQDILHTLSTKDSPTVRRRPRSEVILQTCYRDRKRKEKHMTHAHATGDPRRSRLLDQARAELRLLHYAIRTDEAYVDWIRRFTLFHHKRHPREIGAIEIEAFLTHLAVHEKVAASTQNQVLGALLRIPPHH
jgi:Phage integrase, N-terminal SAM-like domain